MKTRRSVVRLLNSIVPFFFLAVVACIPVSEHPLSPPDPDKIDASVFNLKWVRPENENKGYLFVKYVVKADGLAIFLPDQDVLEKMIEAGTIRGTVEREGFLSRVRISDEPEKIRKLFVEKDGELFRESNVLKRLGRRM